MQCITKSNVSLASQALLLGPVAIPLGINTGILPFRSRDYLDDGLFAPHPAEASFSSISA
jgi:hypothetical protein